MKISKDYIDLSLPSYPEFYRFFVAIMESGLVNMYALGGNEKPCLLPLVLHNVGKHKFIRAAISPA